MGHAPVIRISMDMNVETDSSNVSIINCTFENNTQTRLFNEEAKSNRNMNGSLIHVHREAN